MKNSAIIISLFCVLFFSISTFAQFDIDLEKKIEKKVNKEINKAADDAIDETAETTTDEDKKYAGKQFIPWDL